MDNRGEVQSGSERGGGGGARERLNRGAGQERGMVRGGEGH